MFDARSQNEEQISKFRKNCCDVTTFVTILYRGADGTVTRQLSINYRTTIAIGHVWQFSVWKYHALSPCFLSDESCYMLDSALSITVGNNCLPDKLNKTLL